MCAFITLKTFNKQNFQKRTSSAHRMRYVEKARDVFEWSTRQYFCIIERCCTWRVVSVAKIHEMIFNYYLYLVGCLLWIWYVICRPLILNTCKLELKCEFCGYECCANLTQWNYSLQTRGKIVRKVGGWAIVNNILLSLWHVMVQHALGTECQPFAGNQLGGVVDFLVELG